MISPNLEVMHGLDKPWMSKLKSKVNKLEPPSAETTPVDKSTSSSSKVGSKPISGSPGPVLSPPIPAPAHTKESALRRELKKKRSCVRSKMISAPFNCHNVFTHFPKSADCPLCEATKNPRAQCRIKGDAKPDDLPKLEAFADQISLDHQTINEADGDVVRRGGDNNYAFVVQDAYTKWLQSYPCETKTTEEVTLTLKRFLAPPP